MYSNEFADNRVNQMLNLYKSIVENGLLLGPKLPKINILMRGNHWRWFMGDAGNHRSYVLACLGYNSLVARVNSIVDKDSVRNWYNVKNGTYSVGDAEYIFDSYFDGLQVFRGMV